jgi:VacB/RNase II family 3'-5' exoribonuclease
MPDSNPNHLDLQATAREIMTAHGFQPDFSAEVASQLQALHQKAASQSGGNLRDLRDLLWSSIDNDTSRDLDQIEVAERQSDADTKVLVGIADVDAMVARQTPIDQHAERETTTVYTGVRNFPMLPEELSTGITSLLENQDRRSIVIEFVVDASGNTGSPQVYPALVRNRAQLEYNSVGAWLEGRAAAPPKVGSSSALAEQLKLQDEAAQRLRKQRYERGALNLETDETRAVVANHQVVDIVKQQKNRGTELIEDFMVAANGVVARFLESVSSLRRIVRTPKRWDRIVELARSKNATLPSQPDSKALNDFLLSRKAADPDHFADLSLAVIKLIGPGEYVLERPGDQISGHFGLAVEDYTHSTAPNRRFADIVTQRLLKAKLGGENNPYSDDQLTAIAANCTQKEDAARKVEREMSKHLAAVAMQKRIGEVFDAIVTGVNPHGTFVRVAQPHFEGLLAQGQQGLDVGDKLRAKLIRTDPRKGYIDFARA